MAFGILPVLAIGSAAFSAATSFAMAQAQNRAIAAAQRAQVDAAVAQQRMLAEQAGLEQLRNERQAAQILGRIRAQSADAGISLNSGSVRALESQAVSDLALNNTVVEQNFASQVDYVRSGGQANLAALSAQTQSPLLAGIGGGIGGFQTGLSIGGAVQEFGRLSATPRPAPVSNFTPPRIF
jgi:hypothetical protein